MAEIGILYLTIYKYIGFVDSDDTVTPDMYKSMYMAAAKQQADICICDINRIRQSGKIDTYTDFLQGGVYDKSRIVKEIMPNCLGFVDYEGNIVRIDWCVLRRIFKHSFLSKSKIRFDESLSNSEDCMFVYLATFYAEKIVYLKNEFLYNNIIGKNSLTKRYLPDYWEQRCRIIDTIIKTAEENLFDLDDDMMKLFVLRCVRPSFANIALGFETNSKIKSYLDFKNIVMNTKVQQASEIIEAKKFNFEWARIIYWIKNKNILSIYLYYKDVYGKSRTCHCIRKCWKRISRLFSRK